MPPLSAQQDASRLDAIARAQDQTASRAQLVHCGYDRFAVRRRVHAGRWQMVGRAVVLHNATPTPRNVQWAAILSANGPAAIGGRTAAASYRLRGFESDDIDVVVGPNTKVPTIDGVRWHHSRRFTAADMAPGPRLPAVRPARAVVDAASWTDQPRIACALLIASVQQRVTTVGALREALDAAGAIRHGRHLRAVLADVEGGADSLSEIDLTKLAKLAGLPSPIRQSVRLDSQGRRRYLDVDFGAFSVEIDGGLHLRPLNYWADAQRQNDLVIGGERILRSPALLFDWSRPSLSPNCTGRGSCSA